MLKLDEFVLQLLQLLQGYLPFYSDMKKLIQKNFCRCRPLGCSFAVSDSNSATVGHLEMNVGDGRATIQQYAIYSSIILSTCRCSPYGLFSISLEPRSPDKSNDKYMLAQSKQFLFFSILPAPGLDPRACFKANMARCAADLGIEGL